MKTTFLTLMAGLALSAGLSTSASAVVIPAGSGTESHLPGYSSGTNTAEFTWTVTEAPKWFVDGLCYVEGRPTGTSMLRTDTRLPNFQTFCLERRTNPGDGTVALNSNAVSGGLGAGPNGDPISKGTSWLYARFALGILADYSYAVVQDSRRISANLLQRAIWALEDEIAAPVAGTNKFYDAAVAKFGASAKSDAAGGENGVYVMNIWGTNPTNGARVDRQDFLVHLCVPEGGSTLIVLGLSLCGLSVFRSRLQKKSVA